MEERKEGGMQERKEGRYRRWPRTTWRTVAYTP
jgi:hypothetical protein